MTLTSKRLIRKHIVVVVVVVFESLAVEWEVGLAGRTVAWLNGGLKVETNKSTPCHFHQLQGENGICQNWNLSESVFCHFLKKLEFVRIGICQNRNLSELEFVRIGICQSWNLSELEFVRIGICQNFKMGQIKS